MEWSERREKCNIANPYRDTIPENKKLQPRSFCVYLVVRENLLHLFIHCDCNLVLHCIFLFSSPTQSAIVYNFTFEIHISWRGSLLDDSCFSGHRFTVAIGWQALIKRIKLQALDKYGRGLRQLYFSLRHIKWQFYENLARSVLVRVWCFAVSWPWLQFECINFSKFTLGWAFSNKSDRNLRTR